MFNFINNIKIKTKLFLMIVITIICFTLIGLYAYIVLGKVKVNGPIYAEIIQGKDLIADVLPPPEYIVESYLTVLQICNESNEYEKSRLIDKLDQLKKDYYLRHDFWIKNLKEGDLKNVMTQESFRPANDFFNIIDEKFIPAIKGNDYDSARKLSTGILKQKYNEHRIKIEKVVELATQRNMEYEKKSKNLINANIIMLIVIGAITFSFVMVLFIHFSRFLINSLNCLTFALKGIAEGEGDLTKRININSKDEIGELAKWFNIFIEKLNDKIVMIKKSSVTLARSTQDLSVSSKEIATTSNQQAAAVKEVVSTMEDANALTESISLKVSDVVNLAKQTNENVNKGFSIILQNLDKMNEIKQKNADTISGIKSLNDKINSIGEIVNIINDIADQTKIIAFNAELEASSAGQYGENFKIVASEIRRLANNTVASTKEIKDKINEIQRSSNSLLASSEHETEKIQEGWDLSNQTNKVFEEIMDSANKSTQSAEEISRAIDQQANAFGQVLITLKQISEGINNFAITTKSTSGASESLKSISESLNQIVEKYIISEKEA